MRISFFATPSHRVFNYKPRFYDEREEELKKIYEKYGKEYPGKGAKAVADDAQADAAQAESVAEELPLEMRIEMNRAGLRPDYVPGSSIRGAFKASITEERRHAGGKKIKHMVTILTLLAAVVAAYYLAIGFGVILK